MSSRPGANRLAITIVAAVLATAGGWALRYTVFLDWPAYVAEAQAETRRELLSAMQEAISGNTEAAAQLRVLADAPPPPGALSDENAIALQSRSEGTGELPEQQAARPLLLEAEMQSGCELNYEPLGYYDEAELTVVCDGVRSTRSLRALAQRTERN